MGNITINNNCNTVKHELAVRPQQYRVLLERADPSLVGANDVVSEDILENKLREIAEEKFNVVHNTPPPAQGTNGSTIRFDGLVDVAVGDNIQAKKCFSNLVCRVAGKLPADTKDNIVGVIAAHTTSAFSIADDRWRHGFIHKSYDGVQFKAVYSFTIDDSPENALGQLLVVYYVGVLTI